MVSWWHNRTSKIWLRILSLSVSSIFLFTQVVGASVPDRSFWANRQKSKDKLLACREKSYSKETQKGFGERLEEKDVASEVSSLIAPHNLFTVPSEYGTVKEVHTQTMGKSRQGLENKLIIHIQDAHSSPEAQLNSANILKYLRDSLAQTSGVSSESLTREGETIVSHSKSNRKQALPLLICVEGSSGIVDTTLFSRFPEKKIKEEVASEFLKEGKITGEEYFAIIQDESGERSNSRLTLQECKAKALPGVTIYGVEDKRAYEKNLKAFDEGLSSGEEVRNYLRKVREEINPLKTRLYNKRLKELESRIESYQKKKIPLTQYCQYLYRLLDDTGSMNRTPTESNVGVARSGHPNVGATLSSVGAQFIEPVKGVRGKYPNFELFVQASEFEEKIDFSKVDYERSKYIKELSNKLTNEELSDLLIMSLDYRLGKVTSAEYYTYLQSLSSRMGKGVRSQDPRILTELVTSKEGKEEYPNLNLYIKYNKLYDSIDQNKLFSEISELEEEVKERLCEREEERELVKLSRMLCVLDDLVSLKISNEDLAYYHKHRGEITERGGLSRFFEEKGDCPLFQDVAAERSSAKSVAAGFSLRPVDLSRFEDFYKIALNRNQALVNNTISRMEKEGVMVAVLIAGGFHTPGITELLRDRSISYVVVTPRLGEKDSSDLEMSSRKKRTDLEKAIAGIVGALRPASLLGEQSFNRYSVIQLGGRTLILYSELGQAQIQRAFFELRKNWKDKVDSRPELAEAIEKVDFLPIVLKRGPDRFALGVARGTGNRTLPFVLRYDAVQKKVSEVISGEDECKKFMLPSSFDNREELDSAVSGKVQELWPFLVSEKGISVPGGERVTSTNPARIKFPTWARISHTGALLNAAFGNIGWWLHRSRGGLNDLIRNLFDEGKDVTETEDFSKGKSADAIKKTVSKFLYPLDYDDLTLIEKISLKLRKILGRNGIWNEKEFESKKSNLGRDIQIYYLDSGKNLFWVKGKYAAAHYGVGLSHVYVSAGYGRKASPDRNLMVVTHEALHILGFSHGQAVKIVHRIGREYMYRVHYEAKELMDELAKKDRENARILQKYLKAIPPASKSPIKVVILDHGNVIERFSFRGVAKELAKRFGIDEKIVYEYLEERNTNQKHPLYMFEHRMIDEAQAVAAIRKWLESKLDRSITLTPQEFFEEIYVKVLIGEIPEVISLIGVLKEKGYKYRILTTVCPFLVKYYKDPATKFKAVPLLEDADRDFYASCDRKYTKPHPGSYLEVVEDAGVSPGQCLFIDDRQDCVDGAINAGLIALRFNPENVMGSIKGIADVLSATRPKQKRRKKTEGTTILLSELLLGLRSLTRVIRTLVLGLYMTIQGTNVVRGLLFDPGNVISEREKVSYKPAVSEQTKRAIRYLEKAKKIGPPLTIKAHLRGVDGPGSSLDLPEFQKTLTEKGARFLVDIPSTLTFASEFAAKIRFELLDDPDVVEYVAPDYGITEDNPYRVRNKVRLTEDPNRPGVMVTPHGMKDAPAYIFANLFGIRGVRIICEEVSPMALAGGMESSNAFMVALIAAASMLSGRNLTWAEIFREAVKLENQDFQGLTGGQGHLASILGGVYRHIWQSGKKDEEGNLINPYGAFSIPVKVDRESVESHMALVQAGKKYKDGEPEIARTAELINTMWTDLLRDRDEIGYELHKEKIGLTARYNKALMEGDWDEVVRLVNRYVEIRDELCKRWVNLAIRATKGEKVPEYAQKYGKRFKEDEVLQKFYRKHGDNLYQISLYTYQPISSLVEAARRDGHVAIMALGAGGPGANLIAISSKGKEHLRRFLEGNELPEFTDEAEIRQTMTGPGENELKGWMPFRIGIEPIKLEGFGKVGIEEPQMPKKVGYNQRTGKFVKAYTTKYSGLLFDPGYVISERDEVPYTPAVSEETKRSMGYLQQARKKNQPLTITAHLRGVDGPGSSLDLPEFQKTLTEKGAKLLVDIPSTLTFASEFAAKIRFEILEDADVVEYVAPDYGITEDNPYRVRNKVKLTEDPNRPGVMVTPHGMKDAPAYIFANLFGIRGVRIICEEVSPMALAGGMESSNAFMVALIASASMLSGRNLTWAEIFREAVRLENQDFQGLTGGQGHLASILGGVYRHIWQSGKKDKEGNLINPYGAFSIPVDINIKSIESHMALVQAGKKYKDGKAEIARTAELINTMWTDLLRDRDEIGYKLHKEKIGLTARYNKALMEGDWEEVVRVVNRYVEIRDELCKRWLTLAIKASKGEEVPEYAQKYGKRFKGDEVLQQFYREHGDRLSEISLYTYEPISKLVEAARRDGHIAIMALGAGGPGANLIAISSKGKEHLRRFLEDNDLPEFKDEESLRQIMKGAGENVLKGWIPFKIGIEPIKLEGFEGLEEPAQPTEVNYNQRRGKFQEKRDKKKTTRKEDDTLPVAGMSTKDLRRIVETIKNKRIHPYATVRGALTERTELLIDLASVEALSLEDLVFMIIGATRARLKDLVEPQTVEQILDYISSVEVWRGRGFTIREDESDYLQARENILELAKKFETVKEAREFIEGPGWKGKRGDSYGITLKTLRKFSDGTSMGEVAQTVENQCIQDLGSFGISIAVSLGGTKIGCAAVNPAGNIFARVPDIETPVESDEILFKAIRSQIEAVAKKVGFEKIVKIGVSSPGPLNPETGVIIFTENIPFKNFHLKARLENLFTKRFDRAIDGKVFHDADARAKGETSAKGTLPGCRNMMFLNWGTGIGDGVIRDGKVYWNDSVIGTMVGEIGYTVTRTKDGKYHHYHSIKDRYPAPDELAEGEVYLEHYLGGREEYKGARCLSLIQRMRQQISQSGARGKALLRIVNKSTVEDLELKNINEAARAGNQLAIELIEEAGIELGRGVAAFVKYWKLERGEKFTDNVVLGAGVAKIGNGVKKTDTTGKEKLVLLEAVKEGLKKELGSEVSDSINVAMSKMLESDFDYDGELLAFQPKIEDFVRTSGVEDGTSPLPVTDFGKARGILEQIMKKNGIELPEDVSSGELLSMLHFADEKGHVPIIALDQGTLVVWANPDANKENPSQEDINAATLLRLTIVYHLAKGLREKGKNVGFLLDRPALEALNDRGAEEGRVSNLIGSKLLPEDFKEVVRDVPLVAQMEETRGKRGLIPMEGKLNVYNIYTAEKRDGFTVKEAMELGAGMIKSNVFFYCGPKLTVYEEEFNERQWQFIEKLAKECRENNTGYVSELLFMVPVNKKAEEKEYQKTKEYMEAHAKATIEVAKRMKQIKGITLQKLAHPYPGEAAVNVFSEEEIIVEEFSADELEHIIEQIERPTFEGKVTKEKSPELYRLLLRLKSILDKIGVGNSLPDKFQKKKQIGGLLMLKEALESRRILEKKLLQTGPSEQKTARAMEATEKSQPEAKKDQRGQKREPFTQILSLLFGGLGISLIMNQDLLASVGEIIRKGQQAGWGSIFEFPFGLGLWGILALTVTGIGAWAIYRQVGLGRIELNELERVRLTEALGLKALRQTLEPLFERGRRFVAAVPRQASTKREQLRMSWANLLIQPELSEEEISRIRALAEKLRRGEIARFWTKEGPFFANPEINPWLGWTYPTEEMAGKVGEVEGFAESVKENYERVVVMGKAVPYVKVAEAIGERRGYPEVLVLEAKRPEALREIESEINLEKTLFVVSSPALGEGYETYNYFYGKLTKFYEAQGISPEKITSEVGRHFVGIAEANRPFAKEASEKEFLRVFTEESGVSRSIFSYEGLVPLALAGVNIEKFLESGKRGREMCREEAIEKNPGMQLALFQEKMKESGRKIFMVLPEGLKGFGEAMEELTLSLRGEGERIIPIREGELSSPESYGEKAAFIEVRLRGRESPAIKEIKEAGYPVFEIPLRGKEAIGGLFYAGEFATALSYLMRISATSKGGEWSSVRQDSEEASDSFGAEAAGYQPEEVLSQVAASFSLRKVEPLSEYPVRPEVLGYKGTKVFVFDFESLFDIEPVREATPSRMSIELKVKPKSRGVFKVMEKVVKAAEEAGNLDGVKFAFVSSGRDVTGEVMEEMLRDYMSGYGLGSDVVSRLIDREMIIDRRELEENGGIVGISMNGKISATAVFNIINETLLVSGRADGNGTEIKIITDRESRWAKDGKREMMERILWVLLEPAREGEVLSTAAGLVVAIEGRVSQWLIDFIKARYSEEEAKRLLSQIVRDGKIILPATRVDEKYLEGIKAEERIYKVQA